MAKIDHDLFCEKGNISISRGKTIMKKGSILFLIFLLSFEIVARPVTITGERNEWWIVLNKKCRTIFCDLMNGNIGCKVSKAKLDGSIGDIIFL